MILTKAQVNGTVKRLFHRSPERTLDTHEPCGQASDGLYASQSSWLLRKRLVFIRACPNGVPRQLNHLPFTGADGKDTTRVPSSDYSHTRRNLKFNMIDHDPRITPYVRLHYSCTSGKLTYPQLSSPTTVFPQERVPIPGLRIIIFLPGRWNPTTITWRMTHTPATPTCSWAGLSHQVLHSPSTSRLPSLLSSFESRAQGGRMGAVVDACV